MSTQESVRMSASQPVPGILVTSEKLGRLSSTIGQWASLFLIPMVLITVWDVIQRKVLKFVGDFMLNNDMLDARNWMYGNLLEWLPFRSTLLQELEWHFHVATFALVLGYGYVYNLKPELAAKVKDAFFSFNWEGTSLEKEFNKGQPPQEKFMPINYKEYWQVVRDIDQAMGVSYNCK